MTKFFVVILVTTWIGAIPVVRAEQPAVSGVSIERPSDCGTRPEGPNGCVTPVSVSFDALTTGLCDVFSAKIVRRKGRARLIIKKDRIEHCTRPEHSPAVKAFELEATARLRPDAPIYLANPLRSK